MVPGIAITAATDGVGAPVWVGALTTTSLYTASSAGQAKGDVERAGGTKVEATEAVVESGAETAATVMATYAIAEGISWVIKSSYSKAVEEVEGNNNVKPSSNFTEGSLNSGLTQSKIDEIVNIPKGSRPDPATYLNHEIIDAHLSQFKDGASIVMTKEQYINYVKGNDYIGIPSDGTQFVMPKNYCDEIAIKANGNISVYEKMIGFDIGHFDDGGGLVRIDIDNLDGLNLRMPSGNEAGANSHWIPGGKTDGGVSEAITDLIPNNSSNVSITLLK